MASDDDSEPGVDESTKQVDRGELSAALNKSVDSREVLDRVNREVDVAVHAEGTAQVDRSTVEEYLAAAKSGEFPSAALLKGKTGSTGDEESEGDVGEPSAGSESEPNERDEKDSKKGSTTAPDRPSAPPPAAPPPIPAAQKRASAGDSVSEVSVAQVRDLQSRVETRRHDPSGDTEEARLSEPESARGQASWLWVLVFALTGVLIGVGVGLLYLVVSSG